MATAYSMENLSERGTIGSLLLKRGDLVQFEYHSKQRLGVVEGFATTGNLVVVTADPSPVRQFSQHKISELRII